MEDITIVKTTTETIVLSPKDGIELGEVKEICNETHLSYQKPSLVSDYFSTQIKELCGEYDVVDSSIEFEVE